MLLTEDPFVAAELIRRGLLVAFPTETVYGLGADARNTRAVQALYKAKKRPADNPLIVHIAHRHQLSQVAESVSPAAIRLVDHFFPGPLTVVVRKRASIPSVVTAGLNTIAVRMPSHILARQFLSACGCPVAAPSANRSGRPSATTWEAVCDDLSGHIDGILQGAPATRGIESTVIDCTQDVPTLLRAGVTSAEALAAVVPDLRLASGKTEAVVRSPGLRHSHYAPTARVILVQTPQEASPHVRHAYIGLIYTTDAVHFGSCYIASNVEDYARALFSFFRQCESKGLRKIYCQTVPETGLGLALMDRLRRAAA